MTENSNHPIREFPRIQVEVPGKISTPNEGIYKATITRQIGQGGCMLASDETFGTGRILTLYFNLDGKEIIVIAKVLYEYPVEGGFHCGLKFVNMRFTDTETLKTHVYNHLQGDVENPNI